MVLMEMTLRSLSEGAQVDHADFLARADLLRALGYDVLISRFEAYYQLAEYLSAYTDRPHRARPRVAERRQDRRRALLRGAERWRARSHGPAIQAVGQDVRVRHAARSRHGTRNDHRDAAREGRVGASPRLPA